MPGLFVLMLLPVSILAQAACDPSVASSQWADDAVVYLGDRGLSTAGRTSLGCCAI